MNNQGGQCVLTEKIETCIAELLITCSSWECPSDTYDLRCIVKSYLYQKRKTSNLKITCQAENLPFYS